MPRGSNLKQYSFKPGESGNPNGRPPEDISTKILTRYTRAVVSETLNKVLELTEKEAEDLLLDPEGTLFEKAVVKVVLVARRDGDFTQLEKILDRCIGRVPQKIEGDSENPIGIILQRLHNMATARPITAGAPIDGRTNGHKTVTGNGLRVD